MSVATVHQTREAIDDVLKARGGVYNTYSCKEVSWDDVSRGTISGELSCWGANITDTYLKAKDGTSLFTVRPDNWNERLGSVDAHDVALLVGNCDDASKSAAHPPPLRNVTLRDFLNDPHECGAAYSGLRTGTDLCAELDDKVSIRFQTVFLPVPEEEKATMQLATEAYNYNTTSDKHPRNLVVLCTTQGIAVQADGKGQKRLLHHARKSSGGPVCRFWLEAERSHHQVGLAQKESEAERSDALNRGKAVADVLGLRAMGTRFNVLMTIQIPLIAPPQEMSPPLAVFSGASTFAKASSTFIASPTAMMSAVTSGSSQGLKPYYFRDSKRRKSKRLMVKDVSTAKERLKTVASKGVPKAAGKRKQLAVKGASNAARVSRGSKAGQLDLLRLDEVKREVNEHVTVTVVMYNTVAGGVPNEEDVIAAIDDMEKLYKACSKEGRLSDAAFDFMKKPLTVDDIHNIAHKLHTQPATSVPEPVDEGVQGKGLVGMTQAERNVVQDALTSLKEKPSEQTIAKTRLVVLGAMRNFPATTLSTLQTELVKLESLRKVAGTSSMAFKNHLVMVDLLIHGAMFENFV